MDNFITAWQQFAIFSTMGTIIAALYIVNSKDGTILCINKKISKDDQKMKIWLAIGLNILMAWCVVFVLTDANSARQAMFLSMGAISILGGNKNSKFQDEIEGLGQND
jgi:undecaprenyl pyrophosphate phosphatase UppP